jgi:hypothetical protein
LTGDKVRLWPGDRAYLPDKSGQVQHVLIDMVGHEFVQVDDGQGAFTTVAPVNLYSCHAVAAQIAEKMKVAQEVTWNARKAGVWDTYLGEIAEEAGTEAETAEEAGTETAEEASAAFAEGWASVHTATQEARANTASALGRIGLAARARDAERATRWARKDERETREAKAWADYRAVAREEAEAAEEAKAREMAEREARGVTRAIEAKQADDAWEAREVEIIREEIREDRAAWVAAQEARAAYRATIKAMAERKLTFVQRYFARLDEDILAEEAANEP